MGGNWRQLRGRLTPEVADNYLTSISDRLWSPANVTPQTPERLALKNLPRNRISQRFIMTTCLCRESFHTRRVVRIPLLALGYKVLGWPCPHEEMTARARTGWSAMIWLRAQWLLLIIFLVNHVGSGIWSVIFQSLRRRRNWLTFWAGDQASPKCGRCEASNRECTKGYPYRVYKSILLILRRWSISDIRKGKFADNQKWLKTTNDCKSASKLSSKSWTLTYFYLLCLINIGSL